MRALSKHELVAGGTGHKSLMIPPAFQVMVKPRGSLCNLDCSYCFYLEKEKLYPGASFRMSDELLEEYIRQYIAAQWVPEVVFAWQGGEPTLMGLEFYRKAVALQQKYRRPGMRILNALQTNGTRLDDPWCAFFREHNFLIGLSLDGPRKLHDAYRVDKGGQPTFDRVMAGLSLLKQHQVEVNVLTCVHTANVDDPLAVYRFLRDEVGARYIQFLPIVERMPATGSQEETQVSPRSVDGEAYGHFLNTVFDEWVRRDVGQVSVQMFDIALAIWLGEPSGLCIFDETCGQGLAMEHNGDVYACDHFVEPGYLLGNMQIIPLAELAGSVRQRAFGLAKREALPRYCRECPVAFACHGGCPKDRFIQTPDGEPGLNYLCAGYKAFFSHVDAPMKLMSALIRQGRPVTDVMTAL
ncbi:anaerobic sulfatase maturase [Reticulibacter mediterranei]|uniref:Anaerobic sulfatase maturase n=1 Tax=Reticulibacter mediterranei TaxID=2778369 RepID=A0A8J3III9_9CHLR|nr:anaerobic sulfatase maturase [Reticulibacter mediterranei]GHO90291.1 anaerobic sulfatase maturase [Reticulibacter mediterranei]